MAAVSKKSSRSAGTRTPRLGSIKDELRRKGVKYCYSAYVDVHGVPKGKTVPVEHFERMMRGLGAVHRRRARRPRPGTARRRARGLPRPRRGHPASLGAGGRLVPGQPQVPRGALADVLAHHPPAAGGARREARAHVQPRHRVRGLHRAPRGQRYRAQPRPRQPRQGGLRLRGDAAQLPVPGRDRERHELARLGRALLRSRGRQRPVRVRLRLRRRPHHGRPLRAVASDDEGDHAPPRLGSDLHAEAVSRTAPAVAPTSTCRWRT